MGEARVHLQRAEHQLRHLLARARREGGRVPGRDLHRSRATPTPGGGRAITRVEVSVDGGHNWRLRQARAPLRPHHVRQELVLGALVLRAAQRGARGLRGADVPRLGTRATTRSPDLTWNLMGMGNNPWFRIKTHVSPEGGLGERLGPSASTPPSPRPSPAAGWAPPRAPGTCRGLHDHAPRRRGDAHPREPGGADVRAADRRQRPSRRRRRRRRAPPPPPVRRPSPWRRWRSTTPRTTAGSWSRARCTT